MSTRRFQHQHRSLVVPALFLMPWLLAACGSAKDPAPAVAGGQAHAAEAERPRRGLPPAVAYQACTDKKPGDPCTFDLGDRTPTGTCVARGDDALTCRPQHRQGRWGRGDGAGRRRPPAELFAACTDKNVDDPCQVTFGDRTITGRCAARGDGPLACRPERPPGSPPAR